MTDGERRRRPGVRGPKSLLGGVGLDDAAAFLDRAIPVAREAVAATRRTPLMQLVESMGGLVEAKVEQDVEDHERFLMSPGADHLYPHGTG